MERRNVNQRALTLPEKAELAALNDGVSAAIAARAAWLDAMMAQTSDLQVGDDIYDLRSGAKVGVITALYRYHSGRNDLYDTSHCCHYRYQVHAGYQDNTSRQSGASFGTKAQALARAESQADRLRA